MKLSDIQKIARNIRGLSIDAIRAANSGHPGLPLGCADIIATLYANHLRFNPKQPNWIGRDRFVLSAGHGSMVLYSILHLAQYNLSLSDIQAFRQLNSKTPGHPELYETPGVEATTGPLGQGIAMAVGMALAQKHIESKLQLTDTTLVSPTIYTLVGDGCLMEGISSEACSIAGHLNLNNLIMIYDANSICLDGPISECFSENVAARFKSYGWSTIKIDGHNIQDIDTALTTAKAHTSPTLIIANTIIGNGATTVAGTSEAHGKPLSDTDIANVKLNHSIPESPSFYVDPDVIAFFKEKEPQQTEWVNQWNRELDLWKTVHPKLAKQLTDTQIEINPQVFHEIKETSIKANIATRASSNAIIQTLPKELPQIIGGSADLSCSDSSFIANEKIINKSNYAGRNIKYGVREFAMAAIANGLSIHGQLMPFIGTFLTFSDYCRNAIRLAALMKLNVIYQFTHDSILLGEDGPTHQPVEHLSSLRAIPGLCVIRPGDQTEVKAAWISALKFNGPTALILSRQGIQDLDETSLSEAQKGAYILVKEKPGPIDHCILATGSEIGLAYKVTTQLIEKGINVRLVSMPSFELFDSQPTEYQASILDGDIDQYWSIEAQSQFGWHQYIGRHGTAISVDTFGKSAPASDIAKDTGFTVDAIMSQILAKTKKEVSA